MKKILSFLFFLFIVVAFGFFLGGLSNGAQTGGISTSTLTNYILKVGDTMGGGLRLMTFSGTTIPLQMGPSASTGIGNSVGLDDVRIFINNAPLAAFSSGPSVLTVAGTIELTDDGKIKTNALMEATGTGVASMGANSPATTLTAPYRWIQFVASDGSLVYIPAWK